MQNQEVIGCCGVVQVSSVQTLYDSTSRVSKIFQNFDGFLINSVGVVVLCYCTVVGIGKLASHIAIIEQVIDIDSVDVTSLI